MKRGDTVFLRRPKRMLRATVIAVYDHYPAIRIRFRGEERIVSRGLIYSQEEVEIVWREQAKFAAKRQYSTLIHRWSECSDWADWKKKFGAYWMWSALKKLERLGLIGEVK